jgi:hypothetical protein
MVQAVGADMNGYLLESIVKKHRDMVIDKLKGRDL